jgi:hypothetical protein
LLSISQIRSQSIKQSFYNRWWQTAHIDSKLKENGDTNGENCGGEHSFVPFVPPTTTMITLEKSGEKYKFC